MVFTASFVLAQRELIRFVRQRNRVIGALATPIVFWLLIGSGMGRSFAGPGAATGEGYLSYFFPGTILMILLFTAIFSTISVIEDRREGFLQGVLVAPVGRVAIVMGKVLGGAVLATGQAMLFLLLGWLTGVAQFSPLGLIELIGIMFITSIGLTALGLCIAWPLSSTHAFHALMNIFLMPMWILSGALFPIRDDTPRILQFVMLANPLSFALASIRNVLWAKDVGRSAHVMSMSMSVSVTLVAAIAMVLVTILVAQRRSAADAV